MKEKSLFQCPVCTNAGIDTNALYREEKRYYCEKGHSFDRAGKGYVNLLLPSHTGKGKPGDSKDMLQSRRAFLNKGYYEKFSDRLNELVGQMITTDKKKQDSLLDAGCGEGYYLARLRHKLVETCTGSNFRFYGTDVSKTAINYASGRDRGIYFAVGSSYHLPILEGAMDFVLCVFAPRDEREFRRVLKPGGRLIVAAPGERHLYSLRRELYENPELIGERGTVKEGFILLDQVQVEYELYLKSGQDISDLLKMTPYSQHITGEAVEDLKNLEKFTTEVEIKVMVYQKL